MNPDMSGAVWITSRACNNSACVQVAHLAGGLVALRDSKDAFTFITLWISKAPQSAVGTAQAPGHVDVNELELFPTT